MPITLRLKRGLSLIIAMMGLGIVQCAATVRNFEPDPETEKRRMAQYLEMFKKIAENSDDNIFTPIRAEDVTRVKEILNKNPSLVNSRDDKGAGPLHHAANHSSYEIVKLLLDNGGGSSINNKDHKGDTPLILSMMDNSLQVVSLLLESGALTDLTNHDGLAAIHIAALNPQKLELLLKKGADVNVQDTSGKSPLHYAADYGVAKSVELLLASGADPRLRSRDGRAPAEMPSASDEIKTLLKKSGPAVEKIHELAPNRKPPSEVPQIESGQKPNIETALDKELPNTAGAAPIYDLPLELYFLRAIDRFLIALTVFVAAIGLIRTGVFGSRKAFGINVSSLQHLAFWTPKWDFFLSPLFACISGIVNWYIPYGGQKVLLIYCGVVMPLCVFVTAWNLAPSLAVSRSTSVGPEKRMAVALSASLLAFQFGFEPWKQVMLKVIVVMPAMLLFLNSLSLSAYRLFILPVFFSLLFSITQILGAEDLSYLSLRLTWNICIIGAVLRAFWTAELEGAETAHEDDWILTALRRVIGLKRGQPRMVSPQEADAVWYVCTNEQVVGPILQSQLRDGLQNGVWQPDTLVCRQGEEHWHPLGTL